MFLHRCAWIFEIKTSGTSQRDPTDTTPPLLKPSVALLFCFFIFYVVSASLAFVRLWGTYLGFILYIKTPLKGRWKRTGGIRWFSSVLLVVVVFVAGWPKGIPLPSILNLRCYTDNSVNTCINEIRHWTIHHYSPCNCDLQKNQIF